MKICLRRFALVTLVLLVAGVRTVHAQGGGFVPGEFVLYRHDPPNGELLRIDPLTGQTAQLASVPFTTNVGGQAAYDPFRDRIVLCGALQWGQSPRAYLADGAGNLSDLGLAAGLTPHAFAPTGDGRIYFMRGTTHRYVDASSVEHTVMDAGGAQPFQLPTDSNGSDGMIYDAGEHALFSAYQSQHTFCPAGSGAQVSIYKLPLSVAGDRVIGPVGCSQHVVSPAGQNLPVGWSRGPGGQLLLAVDSNTNDAEPRLLLVDPVTLATSNFAIHGPFIGAAALMAGSYSSVRGQAVILDGLASAVTLRSYSQGESGAGTVIASPMPFVIGGPARYSMFEVPTGNCGVDNVSLYCTAKTTSNGCVPQLATFGGPMLSASSGFVVTVTQIEPQKVGIFLYGKSGRLAAPFQGGLLCVSPPIKRTPGQSSGGGAACTGHYSFDFLAWLASGNDPLVAIGTQINGQFWFRDPASVNGIGLSAGVEWTMCP